MQFSFLILHFIQSVEIIQAFASFFSLDGSHKCQVKAQLFVMCGVFILSTEHSVVKKLQ